jgi:hypothetical protein
MTPNLRQNHESRVDNPRFLNDEKTLEVNVHVEGYSIGTPKSLGSHIRCIGVGMITFSVIVVGRLSNTLEINLLFRCDVDRTDPLTRSPYNLTHFFVFRRVLDDLVHVRPYDAYAKTNQAIRLADGIGLIKLE